MNTITPDSLKNQVCRKRKRTVAPKLVHRQKIVKRCVVHDILRRNVRGVSSRARPCKFKNFKCVSELDTFEKAPVLRLPAMRLRSRIVELVVAENLIFGLTHSGVCMAFDLETKKRLCIMNTSVDEVVRSLFHVRFVFVVVVFVIHTLTCSGKMWKIIDYCVGVSR